MKISVGLLAYNSENWIQDSAGCLRPFVDEVIVLMDDATTDKTEAKALQAGADKVIPFTWKHDYAYAKNLLIDNLTGDWIIILDDDEKLSATGALKLTELIKEVDKDPLIQGIQIGRKHHYPMWTTDEEDYLKDLFPDFHTQAFRKGNKYTGIIHEGVIIPPEQLIKWDKNGDIYVHHHAYKGDREKNETPHHNYYKDLTEGKTFQEGEHVF